jgi:hypothetical protein
MVPLKPLFSLAVPKSSAFPGLFRFPAGFSVKLH